MISDFAKEKVFWTRNMNLKLVKFIESNPNIWDPTHRKYTSTEYRDKTYAAFAFKYGNEFTRQAVKDRWTNIRSTFANYVRKLKASQARNDGEEYKVNWHLWDACKFLLNINKRNSLRSTEYPEDENKDGTDVNNDETGVPIENNNDETSSQEDEEFNGPQEVDPTCENIANGILNVFKGVQNGIFNVENTEYADLSSTLLKKLSQMSSYDATQMTSWSLLPAFWEVFSQ